MMMDERMEENKDIDINTEVDEEEEVYKLTEAGIVQITLEAFGISVDIFKAKLIYDAFMRMLETQGYIEKKEK